MIFRRRNSRRQPEAGERVPRILILGGGFAGVYTAYHLNKELKRSGTKARVGIIARENYFVFYPMLPEAISGSIGTEDVLNPIRLVVPGATLFAGEVTNIDLARGCVDILHGLYGHKQQQRTLYYDHLVVALGGVPGTQHIPGLSEYGFNVQRLSNAFALRNHIIDTLEQANTMSDPDARRRMLTFVVIGGGPSGVEVVSEIESLLHEAVKYFRQLEPEDARIVLVHAGDRLMNDMPEDLARYAEQLLRKRGVEVRLGQRVTRVERHSVHLDDGTVLAAETVVGSLGLDTNPLVAGLPVPQDKKGRIVTDETLQAGEYTNVWALGDNARVVDHATGELHPATAQHAVRQAKTVARNIAASLRGEPLKPMSYKTKGRMVPLGRNSAIAQIYGVKLSGFPAWFIWRTYYLYQLPRWEKRLRVIFSWTLDLMFPPRLVQLKVGQPTPMADPVEAAAVEAKVG